MLTVGTDRGVEGVVVGVPAPCVHARSDGGPSDQVPDEDVGVAVPVAGHQVRGIRGERHVPAVVTDRGIVGVGVGVPAPRVHARPDGGPSDQVPDEHVVKPVVVPGHQI
jgi:hypothetical protein